jgi:hypothetical protein
VLFEGFLLDGEHAVVDEAVAVVVLAVAELRRAVVRPTVAVVVEAVADFDAWTDGAVAFDGGTVGGTYVDARDAFAHGRATGLAELRPELVDLIVEVVVGAVTPLGARLVWKRLRRTFSLALLAELDANAVDLVERMGAADAAARRGVEKSQRA